MKVQVTESTFDDASRGRYGIKTWYAEIMLEGIPIFARYYQQNFAYSSGYAGLGEQVRNKAEAKTKVVADFAHALNEKGIR